MLRDLTAAATESPILGCVWRDIFIAGGGEYRQVFYALVTELIESA